DSEEIAEEALRLIEIEYRTLPFVLDAESALASGAPSIRGGSNLAGREPILLIRGDVDRGMSEAHLIVDETYRTQSTSPLALEPRYSLARWDGDQLTVWKASRNVYGDRDKLAKVFALTHDQVRVIGPYLGGGFGSKDETRLGASRHCLHAKQASPCAWDIRRRKS